MTSTLIAALTSLLLSALSCGDAAASPGGGRVVAPQAAAQQDPAPAPSRVLFVTQSAGYEHGVVKRASPGQLAVAERGLSAALADSADSADSAGPGYALRITQDASQLPALLPELDAVVFYTTGELPLSEAERAALLDWVADGGAFVGLHCASDTMYASPAYLDMLGGTFDGHPWHQEVTLKVEWPEHPALAHLPPSWTLTDEIYQFRAFERWPNAVLLSLSGERAELSKGKRADGDYASAWCKPYGRGRVFYTALGHRPELWNDERFLAHVRGGLDWALKGPDLPAPPPQGAVVLVGADGPDRGAWSHRDGGPFRWAVGGAPGADARAAGGADASADGGAGGAGGGIGAATVAAQAAGAGEMTVLDTGAGDLVSQRAFGDTLIHVEFMLPTGHEGRGNSGVYVQGRYELQVIDPSTAETPDVGTCGAVYGVAGPSRAAIRAAGVWQTYDIRFRAPRFDASGARTAAARLSLWHNGIRVHDELELPDVTPGGIAQNEAAMGPLMLQDHGDPVRYRNIWVAPLRD